GQAYSLGLLWREEARDGVLDIADISKSKEGLPEPDGFNKWIDPHPPEPTVVAPAGGADPIPKQGNTGAVKGGTNQGVTDHSGDTKKK
ncbi:MAG: hypothetical protein WC322_02870, partial [Candidatus Paceibacterota bacterium]